MVKEMEREWGEERGRERERGEREGETGERREEGGRERGRMVNITQLGTCKREKKRKVKCITP